MGHNLSVHRHENHMTDKDCCSTVAYNFTQCTPCHKRSCKTNTSFQDTRFGLYYIIITATTNALRTFRPQFFLSHCHCKYEFVY
jgi:hypothetical protein